MKRRGIISKNASWCAQTLQEIRTTNGQTWREIGEHAGVTPQAAHSTLRDAAKGKKDLELATLEWIAEALGYEVHIEFIKKEVA